VILGVKPITASADSYVFGSAEAGLPGGTRTPDLLLRRQLLYPVELRADMPPTTDICSNTNTWGSNAPIIASRT
jgi:hypothetical protein